MSAKELNIGDYVRTSAGEIGKIIECPEDFKESYGKMLWIETIDEQRPTTKKYIIKSSPNIIDLIEVGDYVNGYLVTDISLDAYKDKILFVGQRKMEESGYYRSYYNNQIKSVVTKEQFESIKYEVK